MKISACVITKNEEANLPRWLKNMQSIVDEIIVVDTGSTDRTRSIAKAAGAKLFQLPWEHDFAAAKNYAIEQAGGDWILFPDADEFFSEAALRLLPSYLLKYDKTEIDAFLCTIKNIDLDQNGRILQISHNVRIFRKTATLRFTGRVHEQLVDTKRNLKIGTSDELELIHIGYSSKVVKEKAKRNLEILQKIIHEQGMRPEYDRYFCDCYGELGDFEQAELCARRYLSSGVQAYGENRDIYKKWLEVLIRLNRKNPEEILACMDETIKKFPKDPVFVFLKGKYCALKKQDQLAEQLLLEALEMERSLFLSQKTSFDRLLFEHERPEAYLLLGAVFSRANRRFQAQLYFEQALRLCPCEKECFLSLFSLVEVKGEQEVLKFLQLFYNAKRREDRNFLSRILKSGNASMMIKSVLKRFLKEPL